ncbi:MAG: septum formation initiator family protein [Spirochaetes bacterium]|jgi:cell division protein FtsB|nr:septum formation initiator family protein [Spirochaetota bacterium]
MLNNRYSFIMLLSALFAVYCFIFGESGILERQRLADDRILLENRIKKLEKENNDLAGLSERYKKGEFLKEEATKSGYITEGEKVLFFKKASGKSEEIPASKLNDDKFSVNTAHLRILWVVISLMVLLIYYIIRSKYKRE